MSSAAASDVQKNFGLWHDKALQEPVQITKYGRETVYMVSAETFHELWACYRRAGSTRDLSSSDMALLNQAKVPAEHDYDYDEDPEPSSGPGIGQQDPAVDIPRKPLPGMVLGYSYLWYREANKGETSGRMNRPAAIVLVRTDYNVEDAVEIGRPSCLSRNSPIHRAARLCPWPSLQSARWRRPDLA
jgi:antitoxin StbD